MTNLFKSLVFGWFLSTAFAGLSQDAGIIELLEGPPMKGAQVSMVLTDNGGQELFTYNPDYSLIPASTYKLITTLCIHYQLGPDFRFETVVGYRGELLEDGSLYGDLVITASGDPSFGSDQLEGSVNLETITKNIAESVTEAGIRCIEGSIQIDQDIFDENPVHPGWMWDDLTNYYASGCFGLNVNENEYEIYFKRSSQVGVLTEIQRIVPPIPGLSITNRVVTGPKGSGDQAYIYGAPLSYKREIRGSIPPGEGSFMIRGAIPYPAGYFAAYVDNVLTNNGIKIGYNSQIELGGDENQTLYVHRSPSLKDLVARANFTSNNLYCDSFMKKLGARNDRKGSYENGAEAIEEIIAELGLSSHSISLNDGSGLSMRNRLSTRFMNQFIHSQLSLLGTENFIELIPKAGRDGGMKNFLNRSEGQQSFWLKSGSMNGVLGYSGLMRKTNGDFIIISMLSNGHLQGNSPIRRQFEEILDLVYHTYSE